LSVFPYLHQLIRVEITLSFPPYFSRSTMIQDTATYYQTRRDDASNTEARYEELGDGCGATGLQDNDANTVISWLDGIGSEEGSEGSNMHGLTGGSDFNANYAPHMESTSPALTARPRLGLTWEILSKFSRRPMSYLRPSMSDPQDQTAGLQADNDSDWGSSASTLVDEHHEAQGPESVTTTTSTRPHPVWIRGRDYLNGSSAVNVAALLYPLAGTDDAGHDVD
jgi:hypothetical protein